MSLAEIATNKISFEAAARSKHKALGLDAELVLSVFPARLLTPDQRLELLGRVAARVQTVMDEELATALAEAPEFLEQATGALR